MPTMSVIRVVRAAHLSPTLRESGSRLFPFSRCRAECTVAPQTLRYREPSQVLVCDVCLPAESVGPIGAS